MGLSKSDSFFDSTYNICILFVILSDFLNFSLHKCKVLFYQAIQSYRQIKLGKVKQLPQIIFINFFLKQWEISITAISYRLGVLLTLKVDK